MILRCGILLTAVVGVSCIGIPMDCGLAGSAVSAAEPEEPSRQFSLAMHAWRQNDLQEAAELLESLVANGSDEPQVWYYRGVVAEQLGHDGTPHFERAAELETNAFSLREINRDLEPVQGSLRLKIEKIRRRVRVADRPDNSRLAEQTWYREGVRAMQSGDAESARDYFTRAIEDGTSDPRPYFLRGVLKYREGDTDAATADVKEGIAREDSTRAIDAVDRALEDVQGQVRLWLEKKVAVDTEDGEVTRGQHRLAVIRRQAEMEEQLLAANDTQQDLRRQQEAERERERMKAAAEKIEASEEKQQEIAEILSAPPKSRDSASPVESTEPSADVTVSSPDSSDADGGAGLDFSWLPPETEVALRIKVSELVNSALLKPLLEAPEAQQGLQQMAEEAGFTPQDIQSVTVSFGRMAALMMQGGTMAQGGPPNPDQALSSLFGNSNTLVVVRSHVALDYQKLNASAEGEEVSFADTTYYRMPSETPDTPPLAAYPVDETLYLFGSEQAVKAAIQRGPGQAVNPHFRSVPTDATLALAVAGPNLPSMSQMIPPPDQTAPPFATQLTNAIRGNLTGAALTIDVGGALDVAVHLTFSDREAGAQAADALDTGTTMLKQMFVGFKASIPEVMQDVSETVVNSASAEFSEPVATWSLTIPREFVTTFQENADEIIGPLMMKAMGGGDFGPGDFGPGDFGPGDFEPGEPGQFPQPPQDGSDFPEGFPQPDGQFEPEDFEDDQPQLPPQPNEFPQPQP